MGDTGKVVLHWREAPALALVTFQGARVLDYKLVELKNGTNEISIPMVANLAPNFDLSVAVMTNGGLGTSVPSNAPSKSPKSSTEKSALPIVRFHQASSPFSVERDLRVKIAVKRKSDAKGPVRPGEDIEVTITTTDPQGKPVAAELSLALIEQSLLEGLQAGARYCLAAPRRSPQGTAGAQLGRLAGESMEFMDHREYQPGDDLRRLDWAAYAARNVELYKSLLQ